MDEPLRLYPDTVDSHLHLLQMHEKGLPVEQLLESCFQKGLRYALDIGVSEAGFETRLAIGKHFPGLFHSMGFAPSELDGAVDDSRTRLRIWELGSALAVLLKRPRLIAVGEIGLDGWWKYGTPELQEELFRVQLHVASDLNLPVIVHTRDADEQTIRILTDDAPQRKGIIHCFSSGPETAETLVNLGFYVSFAGNLTYPRSEAIREAALRIPADRLLFETDSPYLAPVPVRGKPNHPGNIGYTAEVLAALKGMETEDLVLRVRKNFEVLFNLSS